MQLTSSRWTILLTVSIAVLNLGVYSWAPGATRIWLAAMEYDGAAIQRGQLWRLATGNLVHYSPNHFYLDVGVFLVLGLLYEPYFRRVFLGLILTMCLGIGLTCFSFEDTNLHIRGLSGVDAGLFTAALWVEFGLARKDPVRWLWVGPAAAIFVFKTAYETATGQSFFSTQNILGPTKLATTAHLAGVVSALLFCFVRYAFSDVDSSDPEPIDGSPQPQRKQIVGGSSQSLEN